MAQVTIGKIVHYVLPNGQHRPAIIVKAQAGNDKCQLQVFTNGLSDADQLPDARNGLVLIGNVDYSKEPVANTWHLAEKA